MALGRSDLGGFIFPDLPGQVEEAQEGVRGDQCSTHAETLAAGTDVKHTVQHTLIQGLKQMKHTLQQL